MRARLISARRLSVVVAALGCVAALGLPAASPAGAQGPPTMTVQRSSLWVRDQPWTAVIKVDNVPLDSTVVLAVHRSLPTDERAARDAMDSLADPDVTTSLAAPRQTLPLGSVIAGDATMTLSIPARTVTRVGVYPVTIALYAGTATGTSATPLIQTVLYLVRQPNTTSSVFDVAFIGADAQPPVLQPDGSVQIADTGRERLRRWTQIAPADIGGTTTFSFDPQLLYGLTRTDEPEDVTLLDALRGTMADEAVIRSTFVPTDLESWSATGTSVDLQPLYVDGQQEITDRLQTTVDARIWFPDPTLGPAGLKLLRSVGVDRVVIDAPKLSDRRGLADDDSGLLQNVTLETEDNSPTVAHAVDPDLTRLVSGTATDAVAQTNQIGAALAALWLVDSATPRGVVIDATDAAPAVVGSVLGLLRTDSPLTSVRAGDLFDQVRTYTSSGRSGAEPVRLDLRTPTVVDQSLNSAYLRAARRSANSHRGLATGPDPGNEIIDRLLSTAPHRDLTPESARTYIGAANDRVDADLAGVIAPSESTITVTSRDAVIPLRITNALDHDITVSMRVRSPRLSFPDGTRQSLDLRPGVNRIDINVGVRTSGEFPLTVELATPDDQRVITKSEIRVRSTIFSGVGVILSIGALLTLLLWWVQTHRRSRRRQTEADADAARVPANVDGG